MNFWNIEQLKKDIKIGNLTEKDRFIYGFIYTVLSVVSIEIAARMPVEDLNIWDAVDSIASVLIPILGTFFAYRENGAGNGTDFLGRFFSVGFVVSIRFLVWLIPIFIILIFYYYSDFNEDRIFIPIEVILVQTWYAILYVRICKHIGDLGKS